MNDTVILTLEIAVIVLALLFAFLFYTILKMKQSGLKSIRQFGAAGDGLKDDTAALLKAIESYKNGSQNTIYFPRGKYLIKKSVLLDRGLALKFDNGAVLLADEGVTITVECAGIDAGRYQIFGGKGEFSGFSTTFVYPQWFGAAGDGIHDDSEAFQKAVNAAEIINVDAGKYVIGEVILPQSKNIEIRGSGFKNTTFLVKSNCAGFRYQREENAQNASLKFSNVHFMEKDTKRTAIAIYYHGYGVHKDHNWVSVIDGRFDNLKAGVDMGYCGQCHFVRIDARGNEKVYNLSRGASFIYINEGLAVGNGYFLYADDETPDGYSNGIDISQSTSVLAEHTDIYVNGWQAVFIEQSGYDLGKDNNAYAIHLKECQDIRISDSWISSNFDEAPERAGVFLDKTHSGWIAGNSFVNTGIGIKIKGITEPLKWRTMTAIYGNKFEHNGKDIYIEDASDVKIHSNFIMSTPDRSAGFEFEGKNSSHITVTDNSFALGKFDIKKAMGNPVDSRFEDNLFDVRQLN